MNQGTTTQQQQKQPTGTNWTYRFDFGNADSETSDITVTFSKNGETFNPYRPPSLSCYSADPSMLTYVIARHLDTIEIQLLGPPGWMLQPESVRVIVSRSIFALQGQRYSPFGGLTFINPQGDMTGDLWTGRLGTVEASQVGRGASERYEMAIAFSVRLPSREEFYNFSYDPEMDVIGS